ncbi:hypothetical protein PG996_005390 [Apiospora saccharicola]|uniref:Uncharacterized protein n=1 Tax=Apiospora saccharicola TaxID=335842 RepID=A0ABR1VLL9_9PEZI
MHYLANDLIILSVFSFIRAFASRTATPLSEVEKGEIHETVPISSRFVGKMLGPLDAELVSLGLLDLWCGPRVLLIHA